MSSRDVHDYSTDDHRETDHLPASVADAPGRPWARGSDTSVKSIGQIVEMLVATAAAEVPEAVRQRVLGWTA
jgi:hypothetical protein